MCTQIILNKHMAISRFLFCPFKGFDQISKVIYPFDDVWMVLVLRPDNQVMPWKMCICCKSL